LHPRGVNAAKNENAEMMILHAQRADLRTAGCQKTRGCSVRGLFSAASTGHSLLTACFTDVKLSML
jgi:hypothetical protein